MAKEEVATSKELVISLVGLVIAIILAARALGLNLGLNSRNFCRMSDVG